MKKQMKRHPYHRLLSAAIVVTALATSGCHMYNPYEPTPPTEAAKALEQLKTLPSLEDTQTQVQAAINDITAAASKIVSGMKWKTADNAETDNCQQPYEQTDGKRYFLPNRIAANITVTEQDWAKILHAAKDAAAKIGATDSQVFRDEPGNHDVEIIGPGGLYVRVGYAGNLIVSGYTGCRLPRDKK